MKPDLAPLRWRRQRGIAAIELAILSIVLFILLLGGFLLGRLVWQYNMVATAAGEGARYLSAGTWTSDRLQGAKQIIDDVAADVGVSGLTIDIECPPNGQDCVNPSSPTTILTVRSLFNDPTNFIFSPGDSTEIKVRVTVKNTH